VAPSEEARNFISLGAPKGHNLALNICSFLYTDMLISSTWWHTITMDHGVLWLALLDHFIQDFLIQLSTNNYHR